MEHAMQRCYSPNQWVIWYVPIALSFVLFPTYLLHYVIGYYFTIIIVYLRVEGVIYDPSHSVCAIIYSHTKKS
jgi:hypothetical protein